MNDVKPEEIKKIAEAALLIPTGDNCQPFRMKWTNDQIEIWYSHSVGAHALNYREQASLISFGCLIEAIDIASSHLNLTVDVEFTTDNFQADSHWANIRLTRSDRDPDILFDSIFSRSTNRQFYKPRELSSDEIKNLTRHPTLSTGHFYFSKLNPELVKLVQDADEYIWKNQPIYQDLLHWMRLSEEEAVNSRNGMSAENMGMNSAEKQFFKLIKKLSRIPKLLHPFFLIGLRGRTSALLKHSSGVVLYTARPNENSNYIVTGRRCYRFWLNLTYNGYVAQPLSSASFILTTGASETPPPQVDQEFATLFHDGFEMLKTHFGFPDNEAPKWMFRVGGKPDKPHPPTLRKILSEFLIES